MVNTTHLDAGAIESIKHAQAFGEMVEEGLISSFQLRSSVPQQQVQAGDQAGSSPSNFAGVSLSDEELDIYALAVDEQELGMRFEDLDSKYILQDPIQVPLEWLTVYGK